MEVPGVEGSDYINASFITVRNMFLILESLVEYTYLRHYIHAKINIRHVQWLYVHLTLQHSWFCPSVIRRAFRDTSQYTITCLYPNLASVPFYATLILNFCFTCSIFFSRDIVGTTILQHKVCKLSYQMKH